MQEKYKDILIKLDSDFSRSQQQPYFLHGTLATLQW